LHHVAVGKKVHSDEKDGASSKRNRVNIYG